MSSGKLRFDLFSLLEWTAGIAFVSALMAGSGGRGAWTFTFTQLPADDAALTAWLEEQEMEDVTVSRAGEDVTIAWSMSVWSAVRHDIFTIPRPPWKNLGYSAPKGMRGSSQWSMFGGSAWLWLSGLGILLALHVVRKRYIERRQRQDLAAPAN